MDGRMRHSLGVLCVSSDCLPHDIVRNTEALSPVFFYVFSGFFGGVKLRRREKEKKVDFPTSLLCPPFPLPFVSCSITALSLHHFQMSASHLFFFFVEIRCGCSFHKTRVRHERAKTGFLLSFFPFTTTLRSNGVREIDSRLFISQRIFTRKTSTQ